MLKSYIKLIRLPNLLMIAAIQYLMRYCIAKPIVEAQGYALQFSDLNFFLLVLTTIFLAASGYIINDYFDIDSDLYDKPEKVTVGKKIKKKTAMNLHIALNIIASAIGFYISYKVGIFKIGFIFVIIAGLLWFYSSSYKKMFLVGNIIVALLAALVPFIVVIFEIPALNTFYKDTLIQTGKNFNDILYWVSGFTFFAFILTLVREIIKDIEDFEGDKTFGSNTMPIIIGVFYSKIVAISLTIVAILALIFVQFFYIKQTNSLIYIVVGVILPLLFLIYRTIISKTKKDFHLTSTVSKIIMLLGVLYATVACYNFSNFLIY